MRILMRNTIFKATVLAGLFSCLLALAGAFSGITISVHAKTAAEVNTREELKQFVEKAIDTFYIDFLIKQQHCDFSDLEVPSSVPLPIDLADLWQEETETIKQYISLGPALGINIDPNDYCDNDKILAFDEVFRGDGDWKSGSIYLAISNYQAKLLFHGTDESLEGERLVAVDKGGRNVADLITTKARDDGEGFVQYCWDDPATPEDNIDDNDPTTAPGDSWKVSYVVDPFVYLGLSPSDVIFISGIYPKTGEGLSGCRPVENMVEEPPSGNTGDSGGGCAIASGSDSTSRSTAFNLLLIVSALFLAVSFRSRATGQRNGVRS